MSLALVKEFRVVVKLLKRESMNITFYWVPEGETEAEVGMGGVEADPAGLEVEPANPAQPTEEKPEEPLRPREN